MKAHIGKVIRKTYLGRNSSGNGVGNMSCEFRSQAQSVKPIRTKLSRLL